MNATIQINKTLHLADVTQSQQLSLTYDNDTAITITGELNREKITEILSCHECSHEPMTLQIGVDEAGRGPLLGSVVVGAVILPPTLTGRIDGLINDLDEVGDVDNNDEHGFSLANTDLSQLNDSKKISEKKRDTLYDIIPSVALGYVTVDVPAKVIDEINILQASLQGMRVAVNTLLEVLLGSMVQTILQTMPHAIDLLEIQVLCDGNKIPPFEDVDFDNFKRWGFNSCGTDVNQLKIEAVVKGDSKYSSIASASVMAKVARDTQMYDMATRYPDYGIEKHKGYPTKAHLEALQIFGVLDAHRRSFSPVKERLKT